MVLVKEIDLNKVELCIELDANSINLWSKKQWISEFNKEGVKVLVLSLSNKVIGVCVFQVVIDEAHINYFSIHPEFRRNGYGNYLMRNTIKRCEVLNLEKLLLEVSAANSIAQKFYNYFNFLTVGKRRNYYKDGSDALLKEKKLLK